MPKAILFHTDFFELGAVKYATGNAYPVTEETQRQVAFGIAEETNVKAAEITRSPEIDGDATPPEATSPTES
ncbi:MAG: hypothetical protein WCJ66_19470 [Verrucomicrobiota bacterium]